MKNEIIVRGKRIVIFSQKETDYISLTDIARYKNPDRTDYLISNWLRNRNTIEFLGIWEEINNPNFNPIEFDGFRKQSGLNSFILTAKQWISKTKAIGIISKPGKYGGTFAHKDIALEYNVQVRFIDPEVIVFLMERVQSQHFGVRPGLFLIDEELGDLFTEVSQANITYPIHITGPNPFSFKEWQEHTTVKSTG